MSTWNRPCAAGARNLPFAYGRGEPCRRDAPGPLDDRARLRSLSEAGRTATTLGQPDLRRRAADARDRQRADGQSDAAAHGRAARGTRADHRRGPAPGRATPDPRGRARGRAGRAARQSRARSDPERAGAEPRPRDVQRSERRPARRSAAPDEPGGRLARADMLAVLLPALALLAMTYAGPSAAQDRQAAHRARMVAEIAALARETGAETGRPRFGDAVMAAMGKVPRHRFVPLLQEIFAYDNRPLPIGEGQTISQPYIVALMTDLLDLKSGDTVLEVGTGSGYQAAVLAELAAKVYTIEIVEPLGKRAMRLLRELGYRNVEVRIGDGYNGWPEAAPFDSIIVTAAPGEIPKPLVDQLKPGGRMVIPVGGTHDAQQLLLVEKQPDDTATTRRTLPVRFVPLTRERERK